MKSSNPPLVSVLMPAYNAEKFVAAAVQSILDQTFRDFEFIIIDDGSTDGTSRLLDEFAAKDDRIRLLRQSNRGLIASLNAGCSKARGTYIARMDSDDISLPDRLKEQVQLLQDRSEVGIVGTWIQDIDGEGHIGSYWPVPSNSSVIGWFLMFGNCLAHPTIMMRRRILEETGFYRPGSVVEDYDLWVRASAVTHVANIPRVLLRYRVYESSVSVREAEIRSQAALRLRTTAIVQGTGLSVSEDVIRNLENLIERDSVSLMEVDHAVQFLTDLYRSYLKKRKPSRPDQSEIALDLIRRLWSVAAAASKVSLKKRLSVYFGSLRFLPDALTVHGIQTAASLGLWFFRESPGTQSSIRSWKRQRT